MDPERAEAFLARLGIEVVSHLSDGHLLGRCPFHKDEHPSFSFRPDEGLWHCFSCQRGGPRARLIDILEGGEDTVSDLDIERSAAYLRAQALRKDCDALWKRLSLLVGKSTLSVQERDRLWDRLDQRWLSLPAPSYRTVALLEQGRKALLRELERL